MKRNLLIIALISFVIGLAGGYLWLRFHAAVVPETLQVEPTEVGQDVPQSEDEAASTTSDTLVTGTVKDLGETCGFGIELDQGGQIVPSDLADELAIPGVRLQFNYIREDIEDECDNVDTVRIANAIKIGNVQSPEVCADSRRALGVLVSLVEGLDKACEKDDDCVAYGDDPRDSCASPKFTSTASLAPRKHRHDKLLRAIQGTCEATTEACEGTQPTLAVCESQRCVGR